MLNLVGFVSFVSYIGVVYCSWATPGPKRLSGSNGNTGMTDGNVRRCYAEMLKDSDISHLLLDTTTAESISTFCGRISFLKKCIAKFEHQLTNSENTEFLQKTQGVSTFYLNVCPPGTGITEKYRKNAHCFQLIKTEILSCGSDLPDMSSYMKNDINARCCALKKHRECTSWAAADKCGKEAEEVTEEILIRYYLPQLEGCKDSHLLSCQQSTGPDQDGTGHHHVEDQDWFKTTVAEEWRRHKKKHHNSGERRAISLWTVVGGFVLCVICGVFLD